ncbi:hypothetical protein KUTeg_010856 [Tegillarca granosa]|uniref:VWFD domain-containing protein n=1 Tax=Tegillarca granosa TaxID=220873 RepID=A0ABQ9F5M6_TEGGR|nr:hypothetical protein KUTeg_010856 [Tegillarca granosa]
MSLCSGFWSCVNGHSIAACCPDPNQRFVPSLGCVDDPTCIDPCPPSNQNKIVQPEPCRFFADPLSNNRYYEEIPGYKDRLLRNCSQGTIFVEQDCGCDMDPLAMAKLQTGVCNPAVDMNFNYDFQDHSGNQIPCGKENVTISTQRAKFSGAGLVNFWRFAFQDFRDSLAIKLKFQPSGTGNSKQALLTNCIFSDKEQATINIIALTSENKVYMEVETNTTTSSITIAYTPNVENELIFEYNGSRLSGMVKVGQLQRANSTELTGYIKRRQSGIVLGAGSGWGYYDGYIDDKSSNVSAFLASRKNSSEKKNDMEPKRFKSGSGVIA